MNVPLVLASNFRAGTADPPVTEYSRDGGTASWHALEDAVGALEGGTAVAFGSGMGAAAAILDLVPVGAHVVVPTDSYAGVRALLADGALIGRWKVTTVDITDTAATQQAAWAADLLWLESPTNPLMDVADLPELCRFGRERGALVVVDNTFATPLLQRPLEFGADLVMHSATKFIGGHSDLLLGLAVTADPDLLARVRRRQKLAGAIPGALEAYLALRGLRTLPVRLARSQESAGELARRLLAHPAVTQGSLPRSAGRSRAPAGRGADERVRRDAVVRGGGRRGGRRRGVRGGPDRGQRHQPGRGGVDHGTAGETGWAGTCSAGSAPAERRDRARRGPLERPGRRVDRSASRPDASRTTVDSAARFGRRRRVKRKAAPDR